MNAQRAAKIKKISIAIIKGILGIITEIAYALSIIITAFFISFLLTPF